LVLVVVDDQYDRVHLDITKLLGKQTSGSLSLPGKRERERLIKYPVPPPVLYDRGRVARMMSGRL
jgi:hypothetical protein